jgi:hypothetical protein
MTQPALFHESINDALRELVTALGGMKKVAARMRPELAPDHAARWLADCLNADRREHLTPEQMVFLLREGRAAGYYNTMTWLAIECGYSAPQPVDPLDERALLQREFIDATHRQAQLLSRLERLNASTTSVPTQPASALRAA